MKRRGADNLRNTSLNDADEPMTKAEREELADLKELVHQQIALEKRVESLEGTWSAFKRVLRDGLLQVVKWVEKNGE